MRADRLVATLLLLQSRGRVTAAEVAEQLEVSLKTARRDLEALSMAGIPVYSQTGKGGGWRLLGGSRTDLSGLTASEARTLFLVAGPSSAVTPDAKAALRKLVRALPETFRADAEAAASAVVLDPTGWGATPAPTSPFMETLQRAVIERIQARLGYADRTGAASERLVHPLGLVAKGAAWYFIADTASGQRTFRVSRIRSVELTSEPAIRPEGFDLAEAWQTITETIEQRRTKAQAVVRADRRYVHGLRAQFGNDVVIGDELADGRLEVEIGGFSLQMIAERIAGWGNSIEVIGPPEIRRHLARIGAELIAAHALA